MPATRKRKARPSGSGPTEHQIQAAYIQWVDLMALQNEDFACVYAVPNAAKRSVITAAMMKREGMRSGVPDICIAVPKGPYKGAYIEFKTHKGVLSDSQKVWLDRLHRRGYACYIARSTELAMEFTKLYMAR